MAPSPRDTTGAAASPGGRSGQAGLDRHEMALRLRAAFLELGYDPPTLDALARACGVGRAALRAHADTKQEAFRFMLQAWSETALAQAMAVGRVLMAQGGGPGEILFAILNRRYGDVRRELAESFHAREIEDQALRRAKDIIVEDAVRFQAALADLIRDMGRKGLMELHATVSPAILARMLCEGAQGVSQTLPPFPLSQLADHYRRIVAAILYGSAHTPGP